MTRGFGLYVHWPFCMAKCPYCDFNSHVSSHIDQSQWQAAFRAEIARVSQDLPERNLTSVFFGGGTPSLMDPETVDSVITSARAAWPTANDIEITLEANPTSVEAGRFRAYAEAGVNRVSIGIQALNDPDLKMLGRLHTAAEARAAFEVARKTFPRISFDLIYARQNQTLANWRAELTEALDLAADHLSLYQLTIEPGTAFGDRFARGRLPGLPDEDLAADMYELTQDMTGAAGLHAYEISNHAAQDAESRHNLVYWRAHDWLGVGPGAHGRFTDATGIRIATEAHAMPSKWLDAVERTGNGESLRRTLDPREATDEAVMMGLRLSEGVASDLFDINIKEINELIDDGFLETAGGRVRTTTKGRPLLNAILRRILA